MKIVLDTNIFISMFLFEGETSRLWLFLKEKKFTVVISKEILQEYIKVLHYPKFGLNEEDIGCIIKDYFLPCVDTAKTRKIKKVILDDPSDDIFLACAISAGAKYIVSGDKHLLDLKNYGDIRIISSAEFLKIR